MKREHFERRAIVASAGRTWVIWTYPRGRYTDPLALPVVAQHGPRHRSHVRIDLAGCVAMVQTLDAVPLDASECLLVGRLPLDIVAEIDQTMKRAGLARETERFG
jgi:hypothetical protein